jgi:hypothetical protein
MAEQSQDVRPWLAVKDLNIFQRMLMCMSRLESVEKSKEAKVKMKSGGEYKYKYAGHDVVAAACHPVFVKFGVYPHPVVDKWEQRGDTTIYEGIIRYINVDKPEEFMEVNGIAYAQDYGDKGPGKAHSYLVKVINLKALLLESGEPDNEESHKNRNSGRNTASGSGGGKGSPMASSKSAAYMRNLLREVDHAPLRDARKNSPELTAAIEYMKVYEVAKKADGNAPARPTQNVVSGAIELLKDMPKREPEQAPAEPEPQAPAPEQAEPPAEAPEAEYDPADKFSAEPEGMEKQGEPPTELWNQPAPERNGAGQSNEQPAELVECMACDTKQPKGTERCVSCGEILI